MLRLIGGLLVALGFGWAGSSIAAPIVTVDGRDWLQPLDFVTLSWNDISSKCDATTGACTGILGATDVTGYTWASVDDVNSLFNFIVGNNTLGPGPDFAFYAYQTVFPLFTTIGFLPTGSAESVNDNLTGFTRTIENYPYVDPDEAFIGRVESQCNFSCIETDVPDRDFTDTGSTIPLDVFGFGGWFFRASPQPPTQVPTPATLSLMGLGLAALSFSRRKRSTT
jgi:PEP-CTERM motif